MGRLKRFAIGIAAALVALGPAPAFAGTSFISAAAITKYDVVIADYSAGAYYVKSSSSQGDIPVVGVSYTTAGAAGVSVQVRQHGGKVRVNCVSGITKGQYVIATTSGDALGVDNWQDAIFGHAITDEGTPAANQCYITLYPGLQAPQENGYTLINNGSFERWGGTTPRNFTLSAGATAVEETATVKVGGASVKITRSGTNAQLWQSYHGTFGLAFWQGRTVTASVWAKCSSANMALITLYDGVDATNTYHTGGGTWERLTVTRTLDASATLANVTLKVILDGDAYFDGLMALQGLRARKFTEHPTDTVDRIGTYNSVQNGDLEVWSAGPSSAPDNFTLDGAGASVARDGATKYLGSYAAAVTRAGANAHLYQDVHTERGISYWQSRNVAAGAWVYSTGASTVLLQIQDGVGWTTAVHPGDSTWRWLESLHTVDASATQVRISLRSDTTDGTGYFDGVIFRDGEVALAFAPHPNDVSSGGGAPTNAPYWTGAPVAGLSAELSLGAITGIVYSTAGTPSAAVAGAGGHYTNPSHAHTGGDGAQIDHTTASNIGSKSHATLDSEVGANTTHAASSGVDHSNVKKNKFDATVAPTVNDDSGDGYAVGSFWHNITADDSYVCQDATVAAAVWTAIDGIGGGDADAIHDNVASEISAITEKASPVSADLLIIEDSADSNNKKRVQIGNLPGGGGGGNTYLPFEMRLGVPENNLGVIDLRQGWAPGQYRTYARRTALSGTDTSSDLYRGIQLPSDYSSFPGSTNIYIWVFSSDYTNNTITITVLDNAGDPDDGVNGASINPSADSAWQEKSDQLTESYTAGDWIWIKVNMTLDSAGDDYYLIGEGHIVYVKS